MLSIPTNVSTAAPARAFAPARLSLPPNKREQIHRNKTSDTPRPEDVARSFFGGGGLTHVDYYQNLSSAASVVAPKVRAAEDNTAERCAGALIYMRQPIPQQERFRIKGGRGDGALKIGDLLIASKVPKASDLA